MESHQATARAYPWPLMAQAADASNSPLSRCLEGVQRRAAQSGVFAAATLTPAGTGGSSSVARLTCPALASAALAEYRVDVQDGEFWVSLVTADRWLSQSIEQDLVHTGDKLTDLLEEELIELGHSGPGYVVEHFRSPDKLFTFRSRLAFPVERAAEPAHIESAARLLLAYEQCFRRLGDMEAGEEE